jgi:hypothetical protein
VRWRLGQLLSTESAQLRRILRDLLPPDAVTRTAVAGICWDPAAAVCDYRDVVVLQLDVCGFTVMSQVIHDSHEI